MNFLRKKAALIAIIILSALCIVAIEISVKVATGTIKIKSQDVKKLPVVVLGNAVERVNINKLISQTLYFNGDKQDGVHAFATEKGQFLVPIDFIFKKIGIPYHYFGSDDLLSADVKGKEMLIRLGQGSFSFDGKEIELKVCPVAAKGYILVPLDILSFIEGANGYAYKDNTFVNYYMGFADKINSSVKFMKLVNGVGTIEDMNGKNLWVRTEDSSGIDQFMFSPDNSKCILKTNDKLFMMSSGNEYKPFVIDAGLYSNFSKDGKYLYWVDEKQKTSFFTDIKTGEVRELGSYFLKIPRSMQNGLQGTLPGTVLCDLILNSRYKMIALSNDYDRVPVRFC